MQFESFQLDNGLKVIVHEDPTVQIAVLNVLYNVGSKDENPEKTGFAHLFEHLMFGGSRNIPEFDLPLQKVGGENNAFTSPDYTNYYLTVPAANLETGFWLESDRMLSLSFDPKVLEVQRKVVIEEFKQRYLDQPYGDAWLKLRPLAYHVHPYRWATIGKKISHIEEATMQDVTDFFYKFYVPSNAILVVAGNVKLNQVKDLSEKWFGPIDSGKPYNRDLPVELAQTESRFLELSADVPQDVLYKVYHMPARLSEEYHAADLLSDILGRGKSSRLHQSLVHDSKVMSKVGSYITGSIDPGLFVISGRLNHGVGFEEAEHIIDEELSKVLELGVEEDELIRTKARVESSHYFGELEVLNKAMSLAYYENLGNASLINTELDQIKAVSAERILDNAKKMLSKTNCSTLHYRSK